MIYNYRDGSMKGLVVVSDIANSYGAPAGVRMPHRMAHYITSLSPK